MSFELSHIDGQKPSDLLGSHARGVDVHVSSHFGVVLLLLNTRMNSLSEKHDVAVGQLRSHVSGGSVTLLPHTGEQLLSLSALQLDGQQPSSLTQPVIVPPPSALGALTHCRWQPVPC